ncbi:hypothetical protein [Calothrix sp. CCY 0018]|uniref:hypothetical protein n=1 Tax=Calothrix sp. CCY 0018 TaxID=3103864 RepID=UPI0039C65CE2
MISNSQECQSLIQHINSLIDNRPGFMQNPSEQYQQRNNYIEILEYAINYDELYHLYDIWKVFARTREEATRGFFLDLWDISEKKELRVKNQREGDILRSFVGQVNNQFDEILLAKKISAPRLWQDYIQELLIDLMWIEDEYEKQLQRKLLYSMSNLYAYLYPQESISAEEEKEFLIEILKMTESAMFCKGDIDNSPIFLNKVFTDNLNSDSQRQFTLAFLYLYRFINHFGLISLNNFVKNSVQSLQHQEVIEQLGEESIEEILERLLLYWGATAPLMELFLKEKLEFKFDDCEKFEEIKLPSPYGTDNFVYTIGASGAGKTYFFHAMEHFSTESNQQSLSIKYIDDSTDSRIDKQKWKAGEELEAGENHLVYMRSKVRNLCRFSFHEIDDKQIIVKDSSVIKWQSLEGYFERHLPSAIILVFSVEKKEESNSYSELIHLLDKIAQTDKRYRNIPIYFIFNKYDLLLEKIKQDEYSEQLLNEFHSYLNSELKITQENHFFSLRYQQDVKLIDIFTKIKLTKACCANLAFINQLNQDIKKVKHIIYNLLDFDFTNLSFIYTSSIFENRQYSDLQTLWSDLNDFIIQATCENLEKYYRKEFQNKIKQDFTKVDLFCEQAKITSSFEVSKPIVDKLHEIPNKDKMAEYFHKLQNNIADVNNINVRNIASIIGNFGIIKDNLDNLEKFVNEQNYQSNFFDKVLRANLMELAIPVEKNQIEECQDYQDLYLKEIKFIDPNEVNYYNYIWRFDIKSVAVENFINNQEYREMIDAIKEIFFEEILSYNENTSKHQLKIDNKDNLEIIIEQLPKQLQAIDIANRNEAFEASIEDKVSFSYTLSNTNALCPIQCGQFNNLDRDLIQGENLEQTVFERLCQFTDDYDKAKKYCQLLTNYLPNYPKIPKYPQFILVKRNSVNRIKVQLDKIRIDVIKKIDPKLKQQQEILIDMAMILLKNRYAFQKLYQGISNINQYETYIYNLYLAKFLLEMLKSREFHVEKFQQEPYTVREKIAKISNDLANIINELKSAPQQTISLEGLSKDYQEVSLSTKLLSFNNRDIKKNAEEIEAELRTALEIYTEILTLIDKDEERLKSLSTDIIPQFSFSQKNEYNNLLKDYEKQRKLLIILERVEFLRSSKWIEDLQWLNDSFREHYTDTVWASLISIDTQQLDEWKQRFIEDIDKLLETELFSRSK